MYLARYISLLDYVTPIKAGIVGDGPPCRSFNQTWYYRNIWFKIKDSSGCTDEAIAWQARVTGATIS